MFTMNGFKHITAEGVANFWGMMDSWGTIGMLWDIPNQARQDALMLTKDFNMTTYIKEKTVSEVGTEVFDDMMTELHEELVDARFALEYAFSAGLHDVICHMGERSFNNLHELPGSDVWQQTTWYPMVEPEVFTDIYGAFAEYCQEKTVDHVVEATICTGHSKDIDGNGYTPQELTFCITGAGDFNALQEIVDILSDSYEYHELKVVARLI